VSQVYPNVTIYSSPLMHRPPISVLSDIAKSIELYLHDESSPHRVVAIDLCARGFHIWGNYSDAMELLRALFTLATGDVSFAPQARLAILQIAGTNSPLFMTTLTLDILHPRSVEHQKSIMQLVAFLIRKVGNGDMDILYIQRLTFPAAAIGSVLQPSATSRGSCAFFRSELCKQS
jgi:hypothetical protein